MGEHYDLPELREGACRVCGKFKYITRKWWHEHGLICKQCFEKKQAAKVEANKKRNPMFGDRG